MQQDTNPQPLRSYRNTQTFNQTGLLSIRLCKGDYCTKNEVNVETRNYNTE